MLSVLTKLVGRPVDPDKSLDDKQDMVVLGALVKVRTLEQSVITSVDPLKADAWRDCCWKQSSRTDSQLEMPQRWQGIFRLRLPLQRISAVGPTSEHSMRRHVPHFQEDIWVPS